MGKRRAERPARRWLGLPPRYVVLVLVIVAMAGTVVLGWGRVADRAAAPSQPRPSAGPSGEPGDALGDEALDLSNLPLPRSPFCALVDDDRVPVALGAPVEEADAYGVGDEVELPGGGRDVSDEFGCTWTGSGAEARAWVFSPAVSKRQARAWAADAREQDGCDYLPDRTTYGRPGLTRVCTDDGTVTASLRGLFGDAWLTCEVSDDEAGPAGEDDVRSRAEQWCVHVATTVGAS